VVRTTHDLVGPEEPTLPHHIKIRAVTAMGEKGRRAQLEEIFSLMKDTQSKWVGA